VAKAARDVLDHHGPVLPEMRLIEDLELDSIRMLSLAIEVENRFRIRLDPPDDAAIETVGDLVRVIEAKLEASP
jgi:acyl carrier protein